MPSFAIPSGQPGGGGGVSDAETLAPSGAAGTITIALSGLALVVLNLSGITSGTPSVVFTGAAAGTSFLIKVIQGATARNLTFPTGTTQAGGGGATYTASGANATDLIAVVYDGSNYLIEATTGYA